MSVPEAENTLFVSHANPIVAGPPGPCGEQAPPDGDTDFPPAPLEVSSNENLQPENGFWPEDALNLSILTDSSAEEKFYKWDLMDDQMKQALRRQFHEQKRQGSRCWRMAGVLGLGALPACGNTLAGVIKNHSKYPLSKLDAVINYVVNVHSDVISLYREFDAMAKQILLGETITVRPTRQIIDDRICRAAATKLTPQQAEENWQQIDPASVSQKLIREFVTDYL
ncbi:hypothetical protein I7I51_03031 [Histoplasma capsulatum]|uniref:Uncharacterized protein n=1 Tax=Ajellomyces capsulatus TaxID=5037 RepID=A0A8A1MLV2_AJECA|nr:hypothetical protein I7I51_03031 [Histoplasma capsulatum]